MRELTVCTSIMLFVEFDNHAHRRGTLNHKRPLKNKLYTFQTEHIGIDRVIPCAVHAIHDD